MRNQSSFNIFFDKNKPIEPINWSINATDDASTVVEVVFDARRYTEPAELASASIIAQKEPLQFRGQLALQGKTIDYNLVLEAVKWPYQGQIGLTATVKQLAFDRPLALRSPDQISDALGEALYGDLDAIVGNVVKPGLVRKALPKGTKLQQQPDGRLLVLGTSNGQDVVVRTLPYAAWCIKFELGTKIANAKEAANQVEASNANPLTNSVTGSEGAPVKEQAGEGKDKEVAKYIYKKARAAGISDSEARAIVAYHVSECASYRDWDKIQNGGKSSGILQWTRDGCENISVFAGTSNAERYAYCKANITNLAMQTTGLLQYRELQIQRGNYEPYKIAVQRHLAATLGNDPLKMAILAYAGIVYYPSVAKSRGSSAATFDYREGANNITLREYITGQYKLNFCLKEVKRLLS